LNPNQVQTFLPLIETFHSLAPLPWRGSSLGFVGAEEPPPQELPCPMDYSRTRTLEEKITRVNSAVVFLPVAMPKTGYVMKQPRRLEDRG
jgi:hypothetical protein